MTQDERIKQFDELMGDIVPSETTLATRLITRVRISIRT